MITPKLVKESLPNSRSGLVKLLGKEASTVLNQLIMNREVSLKDDIFYPARKQKYNNKIVEIDGHKFDSQKEGDYYLYLKKLVDKGRIRSLQLQPRFKILDKVNWEGKTLRARFYVADFQFVEDGKTVVVDVKSKITEANPLYRLKRQLFLSLYPDIEFREMT